MKGLKIFALTFAALFFAGAHSAPAEFSDPDDAARYRRLISELRCLVCQNQNLADSNAELAQDMRGVVARMVREGKPDRAVADFMTARYGDFVLYRPAVSSVHLGAVAGSAGAGFAGAAGGGGGCASSAAGGAGCG